MQLSIKGDIKEFETKVDFVHLLQGFYIRNKTDLTNGRPSWTHEGIPYAIWFCNESGKWIVGENRKIGSNRGWLRSSNLSDNQVPQQAKDFEFRMDSKWFRVPKSVTISITAGMHKNYICDQYIL